eukprot:380598_1
MMMNKKNDKIMAQIQQKLKAKAIKLEQAKFEQSAKSLRRSVSKKPKKDAIFTLSKHFQYGKDPQKLNSVLGKRKILPRLCANDIHDAGDLTQYIDDPHIKYLFCVKKCCYDLKQYQFPMQCSFNLSEQLIKALTPHDASSLLEEAAVSHLVTDKNKDCILQVNEVSFYVKRITQDALSSSMEPRQNTNRISYGPVVLIPISNNIVMRIKCNVVGVGYFDLPNHKVSQELKLRCSSADPCIHRMIHIHQEFITDVYIDFGFKTPSVNNDTVLNVKLIHNKLKSHLNKDSVTLLSFKPTMRTPLPSHNANSNNHNQSNVGYSSYHHGSSHESSNRIRHHPFKKRPMNNHV